MYSVVIKKRKDRERDLIKVEKYKPQRYSHERDATVFILGCFYFFYIFLPFLSYAYCMDSIIKMSKKLKKMTVTH